MKIVFYPIEGKGNKYTDIIIHGLRKNGMTVVPINEFFSNYRDIKIIHLNWYENLGNLLDFLKKTVKIFLFKLLGKKIVWTMHNKISHEGNLITYQRWFMKLLAFMSDKIIIHSNESKKVLSKIYSKADQKTFYLPHPDYINEYGTLQESGNKIPIKKLHLLFVGMIRPYKNIELLIQCSEKFEKDIHLTIAGKPLNKDYADKITNIAHNNPHITLDLSYVDDSKLIQYIDNNDLVVLPYDLKSSLNSGTVFLSFSYGKSVICPEIGTIMDLVDKNFILHYSYHDEQTHRKELTAKIRQAIDLKRENPDIFHQWGNEMKKYVSGVHKKEEVIQKLITMYQNII